MRKTVPLILIILIPLSASAEEQVRTDLDANELPEVQLAEVSSAELWRLTNDIVEKRYTNKDLPDWLRDRRTLLPAPLLIASAHIDWRRNPQSAHESLILGMARFSYDRLRCAEELSQSAIQLHSVAFRYLVNPLAQELWSKPQDALAASQNVLANEELFLDSQSPAWVCYDGPENLSVIIEPEEIEESTWLLPQSAWSTPKAKVRAMLVNQIEKFDNQ